MLPPPAKVDPRPANAEAEREQPVSLVAICAWCGSLLGKAVPEAHRLISHGMCRSCLEGLFAAERRDLALGE